MCNEQIINYLGVNSKMNACTEEHIKNGGPYQFMDSSRSLRESNTLCFKKYHVCMTQSTACTHTHKTTFCYRPHPGCVHRWGLQGKAWQLLYSLIDGRCIFIRGGAMFWCSLLFLIPLHVQISRGAWRWCLTFHGSNYWIKQADLLVAFIVSQGELNLFHAVDSVNRCCLLLPVCLSGLLIQYC